MDDVRQLIAQINSYALMQTSTYSKINLDFVLNTQSYATGSAEADKGLAEAAFVSCLPCDTISNSGTAKREVLSALEKQTTSAPGGTHIPNEMKTQYLKLPGKFNLKKLEATLDGMLYSGLAPVPTNHTQSGTTKAEKTQEHSTAHSNASSTGDMRIFRMKGLVHIASEPNLYILQTVHTIFDVQPSDCVIGSTEDVTEDRSVFVVIGKHLDIEAIEALLLQCLHIE